MPDAATSVRLCAFCPNLCRHVCPVSEAEARETLVPRAKMVSLKRLRGGEIEPTVENSAPLYGCTGCGNCTEVCLHKVRPARELFAGRAEAHRQDRAHPSLAGLAERVREHGATAARTMREGLSPDLFPSEAPLAFLPGCDDPGAARTASRVFPRLSSGPLPVANVTVACGGYPLLAGGDLPAFRAHAERLAAELQGYAQVVVACPACAVTMRDEYPAHGVSLRPEVLHLAEHLARFTDKLPVRTRQPAAFYHDPCYLGRHSGVYDPPRQLLERTLLETHELSRNREHAECSGGGGLLPVTMPGTADAIAEARLVEVRESLTPRVVTACPTCKRRLARDGVTTRDLLDVVDAAIT